jgi:hypothetical protein
MDDENDIRLRRLFASSEPVEQDPAFVAAVSRQVAAHRRSRRIRRSLLAALLGVAAAALAVLLAPFAPIPDGSVGMSLLRLPEWLDDAARLGVGRLPSSPYLYLALAAGVLPIAVTAWLMRRR